MPQTRWPEATGFLFVLEGGDFLGKTLQRQRVAQRVRQSLAAQGDPRQVIETRPADTELGRIMRQAALTGCHWNTELFTFMTDRADLVNRVFLPNLLQGNILICDRFHMSTYAYQGFGRGVPLDVIETLDALASQGVEADITFLFHGQPFNHGDRAPDAIEAQAVDFKQRVLDGYNKLAAAGQGTGRRLIPVFANQDPGTVTELITDFILAEVLASSPRATV